MGRDIQFTTVNGILYASLGSLLFLDIPTANDFIREGGTCDSIPEGWHNRYGIVERE